VQNSLAAIAIAIELGVNKEAIARALASFGGIGRRIQIYGDLQVSNGKAMLVDDYGHHPREIAATLSAIRKGWPGRRVVMVFQPHRYSRTRDLFDDFAQILAEPDVLLLMEVYAAGETPITGADGRSLIRAVRLRGKNDPMFVESLDALYDVLPHVLTDGDILLTLSAGDVGYIPAELMKRLHGVAIGTQKASL
jgi:UDP-N-acetylmuramate--alanine ligase